MLRHLFLTFIPTLVFGVSCFGQGAVATLTGTVTDPSGASIADVTVQAKQTETGTILTAVTSETGNYTIVQLPVGPYEVTIECGHRI